ncbi:MAG: hypothetical protein ABEJ72_11415, partial [Candidatus Aenigmatarchaeota archaeon]
MKESEQPEKEEIAEIKELLRKLLTADDLVRLKHYNGDLSREKASKLGGSIAVVVDGIVLDAMKSEELAKELAPVLQDKIENGNGNPLPFTHILQMLSYRHELEVDGEVQDPEEVYDAINAVEQRMDLDNVAEKKEELEEELESQSREKAV